MSEQRMIAGCAVLQEAAAQVMARYKVVLCEMPVSPEATEGTDTYVVWYIDGGRESTSRRLSALGSGPSSAALIQVPTPAWRR